MFDYTGRIVQATAGRDKDGVFCVVGADREGDRFRLLLADGKRRRTAKPKRKKLGHVRFLTRDTFPHPAMQKLKQGEPLSDRELRRALAAFKGGNHTWQRTI